MRPRSSQPQEGGTITTPTTPPATAPVREHDPADAGFTLIELLVAIVIMGVLMGFALSGWAGWSRASAHESTTQEIESVLRQIQQRAVTEGSSLCVEFHTTTDTWSTWRGRCDDPTRTRIGVDGTAGDAVHISVAEFAYPAGNRAGVTFTPRGTATPGTIEVTRDGNGATHTVTVEGLTGRVAKN